MDQPDNELLFSGRLLKPIELRSTPAGIPIARFTLIHRSRRSEAGQMRDVECRMLVVASGAAVTAGLSEYTPGVWLRVRGFISRAGYRAPETRIELHALEIQAVKTDS